MDLELTEWLESIAGSEREDPDTRRLAQKILRQWQSGIIPSPKALRELRKYKRRDCLCARMNNDGSCDWLKANAVVEGVMPPGLHEKAFCHRRSTGSYDDCTGFRELGGKV